MNESGQANQIIAHPTGGFATKGLAGTIAPHLHTGISSSSVPISPAQGAGGAVPTRIVTRRYLVDRRHPRASCISETSLGGCRRKALPLTSLVSTAGSATDFAGRWGVSPGPRLHGWGCDVSCVRWHLPRLRWLPGRIEAGASSTATVAICAFAVLAVSLGAKRQSERPGEYQVSCRLARSVSGSKTSASISIRGHNL
jgi:hypothetical protein